MKLPSAIEREIRAIEADYEQRGGQQADIPRMRGLRSSIEGELNKYRTVLKEYLEWGAMTGSDRDWFAMKFRDLLNEAPPAQNERT